MPTGVVMYSTSIVVCSNNAKHKFWMFQHNVLSDKPESKPSLP
jgi:hypothetical protein